MLLAENLGKRYDSRWLFRHLEIELESGDKLAVIGRNGSGKSTLLKLLANLISPSEGRIHPISCGYSSLDLRLFPELSAIEHLNLSADLRGLSAEPELLEWTNLRAGENQPVREYSTGMRSRLKLALALQGKPDLLILDEPTAALDGEGQELVESLLVDPKRTIIFATNEADERRFATVALEL